ncbi:unnamed protein product [Cuscuta epithymum]|uniref:Uncharacterized protein n=1 Tax=Cuscuta epithymum TaxID=186058 RepID=A0AAV0DSR2_9ASTE|nr:unnamed protein product [Cuscuta epithymum]
MLRGCSRKVCFAKFGSPICRYHQFYCIAGRFLTPDSSRTGKCVQVTFLCLQDTCTKEEKMLKDPRRLYAAGRLYHIIARKPFSFAEISPLVRTAIPVDGRFEHIVLSCKLLSDHSILCILKESQRALETLLEKDNAMDIPTHQRMERDESLAKEHIQEHKAALQRAVALDVPQAYSPSSYGTFHELEGG